MPSETITTEKAGKWLENATKYALPTVLFIVTLAVGWQTLRSDLVNVRENSSRDAARIETLRTDYQTHQNAITKLEANANAMNHRLDTLAMSIEKRFDALDNRMDTLANAMQALAMALNQRNGNSRQP